MIWLEALRVVAWAGAGYFGVSAIMAYAVGFFVGVNRIKWDPNDTPNKGTDRWFAWWTRFGIRRGVRR